MRRTLRAVVAGLAVLALATPAYAATSRISFKRGTSSAVVSGRMKTTRSSNTYLLKVQDGQTIRLAATGKVSIFVLDPFGDDATDSDLSCNSAKRIDDTVAGDYEIQVTPCFKYDNPLGPYRLTVSVKG
jgi:hypothetical protein